MSGYFRDRYQGAGAIAANARAPRSAPAPMIRRGFGYVAAGAVRIDDKGGDGGGGGPEPVPGTPSSAPVRTGVKAPPRVAFVAPKAATPAKTKNLTTTTPATSSRQLPSASTFAALVAALPMTPAVATAPVMQPRAMTVSGGGGGGGGGGSGAAPKDGVSALAPIDQLPDDGVVESATTAVAPSGGATLWLILGLGGTAAFLAYRHFKKKKRKGQP